MREEEQNGNYFGCGFHDAEDVPARTGTTGSEAKKPNQPEVGSNYFGCGPEFTEGASDAEDYSA